MAVARFVLIAFATLLVAVFAGIYGTPRVRLPAHVLHNKVVSLPNLLTPELAAQLMALSKEMGEFPTNVADLKFYNTTHEHIGEAQPIGADGRCSHPYLVPSTNKKSCVLPGRIDVGRHFLLAGGVEGIKEEFEDAATRLQSFGRYIFDLQSYPVVAQLFASDGFQHAAKTVCPTDKQHLDPFQFNFIVQLPGQTVALHLDAPYFWGATRFQFPQWLLASMVFSNLFDEHFVDQVQVVGYYHSWNDTNRRSGDFVYWDENTELPKRIPAHAFSGNSVDGSKTVHAASIYWPERKAPVLDKSAETTLRYVSTDDHWELVSNGRVIGRYPTDELRCTIVYRARCFADAAEAERFRTLPDDQMMTLDHILDRFREDLVKRGRLATKDQSITAMDLAVLILDEYARYPLPAKALSFVPYNYCALSKLIPSLKPLLNLIC